MPSAAITPSSLRSSNLITISLIIFPFSSCRANIVPLKTLERKADSVLLPMFIFLKTGIADNYLASEIIGPSMPVPPPIPVVLLDPDISLTRWKNHMIVPLNSLSGISFPINALLLSGTGTTLNILLTSVRYDIFVNYVGKENISPIIVG